MYSSHQPIVSTSAKCSSMHVSNILLLLLILMIINCTFTFDELNYFSCGQTMQNRCLGCIYLATCIATYKNH